jgi:hypothetical protein
MERSRLRSAITIAAYTVAFFLCRVEAAHSFITREYTLQEVLDACTNIAFGRAESVDASKQRVIVKLEENVKGKSEFSHININVAVGQVKGKQTSPAMLMEKFKVGLPVIIFYQRVEATLNGLGYVSGTWFQIFGADKPDRKSVWWNFSHLEVYMHRTFSGSTEEFQKVIRAALSGKKWASAGKGDVKVLVLMGNGAPPIQGDVPLSAATATAEFLTLRNFNKVGKWNVAYQETKDRNLSGLHDAHILWIGVDEMSKDGYYLSKKAEDRIKSFVRRGGVVIVTSQDSDPPGKLCGSGWIPEPIKGVEEAARQDFNPTKHAGDIFKRPNSVKTGTVHLDDTWTGWSKKYKILATTNAGKNIALATLQYGKGMYLVTAIHNETEPYAKDNAPLMENIIHFSVKWLKSRSGSGRNIS